MPRIAFLGNFQVPYSTESHHAYTWRKLGWDVTQLQEGTATTDQVVQACENANLFSWTRTHGWDTKGSFSVQEMVNRIRDMKVPSFSYHLDRYWGIQADGRESKLDHPSFHLDYFFSTDGGNEERWKEKGINHVWMLPGVVESGCYLGSHQGGADVPVIFAGSVQYHPEYPFRPAMVARLKAQYGNQFRVIQGVRETELNNAYASARVCIGDHIFAGEPRYVSDRLFETMGRGGFIVYPATEGVTENIPGLVTYHPQDIEDLIRKTNYFLDDKNQIERIERRNAAHEWVKQCGTYTHRLQEILRILEIT